MLNAEASRNHLRHQVDLLTFLAVVIVYIYDASWLRLLATALLRRMVIDHELAPPNRSALESKNRRRTTAVLIAANAGFAVYQHIASPHLSGSDSAAGLFTLFFGTRPSPGVKRWNVAVWDVLVSVWLYARLAMAFGNALGEADDHAKEAPIIYHIDFWQAVN